MTFGGQSRPGRGDLVAASLYVIASGQHGSGAYVAAPSYAAYAYAWLRDGAFCAYAMDLHRNSESAASFHRFVTSTLLAHRHLFEAGPASNPYRGTMPPTRYTLNGDLEEGVEETWPSNFQLDGYGTWLWALRDHARRGGTIGRDDRSAVEIVGAYLQRTATLPCFDCWEEFGDRRHTSTLASVIAGLRAAAELIGDQGAGRVADSLRERLLKQHVLDGSFIKYEGSSAVDASLLWLALPFGVVDVQDPLMVRTAARLSDELVGPTGGVRRCTGSSGSASRSQACVPPIASTGLNQAGSRRSGIAGRPASGWSRSPARV
jgi:isomaltose glucohydrolase